VRIFGFIAAKRAEHSISIMCRVLGVSRSGFHAWLARKPSARALEDARLTARIAELHQRFRGVYGSPRIHAELVLADGERLGRKRVERLMRAAGISGMVRRRRGRTTIRVPGVRVCEDLVDRAFAADGPTGSGSPTSPTSEAGRAGFTWRLFKTSSRAGSWAGRWPITCAQSSSSTRFRWRSITAGPSRD
jgi:transposase InsO family protein